MVDFIIVVLSFKFGFLGVFFYFKDIFFEVFYGLWDGLFESFIGFVYGFVVDRVIRGLRWDVRGWIF